MRMRWIRKHVSYTLVFVMIYEMLLVTVFSSMLRELYLFAGWNRERVEQVAEGGGSAKHTLFFPLFHLLDSLHIRYSVSHILELNLVLSLLVFIVVLVLIKLMKKCVEKKRGYKIVS